MPKRKASAWPASILGDPDVLSLDEEGRFVLCKICHVHYAVHGGKRPKPVVMNSNFRTRAWDVHKLRTNSHRVQRDHERARRQQAQLQLQQELQRQEQEQRGHERQKQEARRAQQQHPRADNSSATSSSATSSQLSTTTTSSFSREGSGGVAGADANIALQSDAPQSPPREMELTQNEQQQQEEQKQEAVGTLRQREHRPALVGSVPLPPRTGEVDEYKTVAAASVVATLRTPFQLPRRPEASSAPADNRVREGESPWISSTQMEGMVRWRAMHDNVSRALRTEPAKRWKPSNQSGSSESRSATASSSSGGNATAGSGDSAGAPRATESYSRRELRAANALARTEEMTGNNHEMVARKLKSLNDQYRARNLRPEDTATFLDPSSSAYKTFWGTFRDVYSSRAGNNVGATSADAYSQPTRHHHHHHHHYAERHHEHERAPRHHAANPSSHALNPAAATRTATREPSPPESLPDSSDDALDEQERREEPPRPRMEQAEDQTPRTWQVAHDMMLAGAFDRLTDSVSTQLSELFSHETKDRHSTLAALTTAVAELGTRQGYAVDRLLDLQERHLETMEDILQHKLWQESRLQREEDAQQEAKCEEMKQEADDR